VADRVFASAQTHAGEASIIDSRPGSSWCR
jgi:hypothetical protein